jgi:eukaryotic-like serine/threonine-protein kinase
MLGDSVRRRNQPRAKPERLPPQEDGPGIRWKLWGPILASAAVLPFLIGYALAVWILFPPPEVAGEGIAVPQLRGRSTGDAQAALASAGLGGLDITRLPHPRLPAGTVIAQSPLPGQQLRAGVGVRVAVSSGVPRVVVPDVVGFQVERARGLLERLGFAVQQVDEEGDTEAGRVTGLEPGPGARLPLPATVQLTVSTGPPALLPDTGVIRTDTTAIDTLATPGTPPRPVR